MTNLPAALANLTPDEASLLNRLMQRCAASPEIIAEDTPEGRRIRSTHPNEVVGAALLMQEIGARDVAFGSPFLAQLVSAASGADKPNNVVANFLLAAVKDARPRDAAEAMLAAQMAAVHVATMRIAGQLAGATMIPHQEAAARGLNTLARTYAAQMDTLKRYRSKGEQKVTVHHVTVNDGGQAVVGNLGGGGNENA